MSEPHMCLCAFLDFVHMRASCHELYGGLHIPNIFKEKVNEQLHMNGCIIIEAHICNGTI